MSFSPSALAGLVLVAFSSLPLSSAQSAVSLKTPPAHGVGGAAVTLWLRPTSTAEIASEAGGAFMSPSKCDSEGNLYIRKYAMDRPQMGPVVKINPDGKRVAVFDPSIFSDLGLDRADAFSPAPDGGMYQIAQSGVLKPRIYVLHFSSDGTPTSPIRLDADLEVYAFAAFADGNLLVSGVQRDVQNKNDRGRNFTAIFSADGRELAQLNFGHGHDSVRTKMAAPRPAAKEAPPILDLADSEVGEDGYLYVLRSSSPAIVYVISSNGRIERTLKLYGPVKDISPSGFHVSGNRLALSFWNEQTQGQTVVVADAQKGRNIATYSATPDLGPSFSCYSANDGVFTFLKLGDANALQVLRAEAQ